MAVVIFLPSSSSARLAMDDVVVICALITISATGYGWWWLFLPSSPSARLAIDGWWLFVPSSPSARLAIDDVVVI
jgi:uncharacterized membrane protein YpjA